MSKIIIITELSNHFDKSLAHELFKYYQDIKEAEIQNKYDYVGQLAGHFFETTIKVILNIKFQQQPDPKGIDFEKSYHRIIKEPKPTIEDEVLCLIIPQILKAGYTLRNKKRISHSRGFDPNFMDSRILCSMVDWILAELLRLYHSSDENDIKEIIDKIIMKKIPSVEMINDEIVILNKSVPASHAILIVLYVNEGSCTKEDIKSELLKYYSAGNISTSLGNNVKSRMIHKDDNGIYHLTAIGYRSVKDLLNDYS